MKKNKLFEEILSELIFAKVPDPTEVINGMCIAFDVEEVTEDVVKAIREDYLS
jgi:hypothetical protein